jgi:uncharacterized integral membrane protein (TIGR00698 family)
MVTIKLQAFPKRRHNPVVQALPGIALCVLVSAGAYLLEALEHRVTGKAWLEAMVLAILLGTLVRSLWTPTARWRPGITSSAKYLLEIAVVLPGASVSAATVLAAGPALLLGIAMVVTAAILLSLAIGISLGLPVRMAILVACGNSICGNSAIAAVAPVIGADSDDVAASIAFTAVLGVIVVIGLPVLGIALGMSGATFGAFAGLTVYAVPQVIAAASPFGPVAIQMGTLVKLVRVLMLGPVCLILSLAAPHIAKVSVPTTTVVAGEPMKRRASFAHMVPWFIIGFLGLMIVRSAGFVPASLLMPIGTLATVLTIVSMAALGLGVDVRTMARAGGRVVAATTMSLIGLGIISIVLLHCVHLG